MRRFFAPTCGQVQIGLGPIELNAVDINPARPHQFAIAGEEEFAYVYDARRLARPSVGEHVLVTPVERHCPGAHGVQGAIQPMAHHMLQVLEHRRAVGDVQRRAYLPLPPLASWKGIEGARGACLPCERIRLSAHVCPLCLSSLLARRNTVDAAPLCCLLWLPTLPVLSADPTSSALLVHGGAHQDLSNVQKGDNEVPMRRKRGSPASSRQPSSSPTPASRPRHTPSSTAAGAEASATCEPPGEQATAASTEVPSGDVGPSDGTEAARPAAGAESAAGTSDGGGFEELLDRAHVTICLLYTSPSPRD